MYPLNEEIDLWLRLPVTQEYLRRVIALFDHQHSILCAEPGTSVDWLRGRAQVLEMIHNPRRVFEE